MGHVPDLSTSTVFVDARNRDTGKRPPRMARKGCRWELERQDLRVAQAQPHSQILQTLEGSSGHGRVQHSSWDWVFSTVPQQEFPDPLPLPIAPLCLGVCYSCLSLEFPCPPARRADTIPCIFCVFSLRSLGLSLGLSVPAMWFADESFLLLVLRLWGSRAQSLSVSLRLLITENRLPSASVTFLSSNGQVQTVAN